MGIHNSVDFADRVESVSQQTQVRSLSSSSQFSYCFGVASIISKILEIPVINFDKPSLLNVNCNVVVITVNRILTAENKFRSDYPLRNECKFSVGSDFDI